MINSVVRLSLSTNDDKLVMALQSNGLFRILNERTGSA